MPTRRFETTQLIEWGIHQLEDCEYVVQNEIVGTDKFEHICELIFMAPDDNQYWCFRYEANDGAGYNDIVGTSWGDNVRPERDHFDAWQVRPMTITTVVYKRVEDQT